MGYETIRYEVGTNGVATITLDQPETRNALSDQVLGELLAAFGKARGDDAVRCVVLTSSHEKVFSAGGNLAEFSAPVPLIHKHQSTDKFPRLFTLIGELGKPTICAANGHVLAGAVGVALACDLIIAKGDTRFGTPEINIGLFPFMVMVLLFRNVARKKATELLLLGEQISAAEAERIGLINKAVPAGEFEGAVAEWAEKLASKSPVVMGLGKQAMFNQHDMAFAEALEFLRSQLTLTFSTEDALEGVRAFFEKREPVWAGE